MPVWVFILFFSTIQVGCGKTAHRTVLQFHAVESCKGVQSHVEFKNMTITRSKQGASFLSGSFYNRKVLKSFSKLELVNTKCADAVSFNTCEYEATYKFSVGLCQIIMSPSMPWSSALTSLTPPVRCPMQTGGYELKNASVDISALLKALGPTFLDGRYGNVYISEVRCFNEKSELHLCSSARYSFVRVRN